MNNSVKLNREQINAYTYSHTLTRYVAVKYLFGIPSLVMR